MREEGENSHSVPAGQKPTIGRKLSRVLSIFRKNEKSSENVNDDKCDEPLYEELIYGDISSPQNFVVTNKCKYDSTKKTKKNNELTEILRLGKPFPQVYPEKHRVCRIIPF